MNQQTNNPSTVKGIILGIIGATAVSAVVGYSAGPTEPDYCRYEYSALVDRQTAFCPAGERPRGDGWEFRGSNAGTELFFRERPRD